MKLTMTAPSIFTGTDHKKELAALKRAIAKSREDTSREAAVRMLVGTGMFTKSGKLKKQFR
jgi:hypothetical protein